MKSFVQKTILLIIYTFKSFLANFYDYKFKIFEDSQNDRKYIFYLHSIKLGISC